MVDICHGGVMIQSVRVHKSDRGVCGGGVGLVCFSDENHVSNYLYLLLIL